jgi:hypothetical protein
MSGCSHQLRPDPEKLTAIGGSYPTAEFVACGSLWHGVGVCVVEEGTPLESLGFSIQGYYQGTLRVDSGDCSITDVITYKDSQLVGNILRGSAERSCIITFTVSPVYPGQKDTEIVTSSFRGHLRIKVVEKGEYVKSAVFRIPQTFHKVWSFGVGEEGPVDVYFEGCGVSYHERFFPGESHTVKIPLEKLFAGQPRFCVLEGLVRSKKYKDLLVTAAVAVYADPFNLLPLPGVEYSKGKLKITSDNAVAVLSVGNEYSLDNPHAFKVSSKAIVRLLTVKGRSNIGIFDPATGRVQWILR